MSNNPPLPEPDSYETTVLPSGETAAVSRAKNSEPRRAYRRERLLQREDWPTLLVLVAFGGAAGFLGAVLAIFLFT